MAGVLHLMELAAVLSFDSLLAGIAAAPLIRSARQRIAFAVGCGVCDGAASFVGSLVPEADVIDFPHWLTYLAGVLLLLRAMSTSRKWLFVVPILLSLDNLFAGAPTWDFGELAISSTVMASAGLALGTLSYLAAQRTFPQCLPALTAARSIGAQSAAEDLA